MKIFQILKGINNVIIFGNINKNIKKLSQNSKNITKNSIFFCLSGTKTDGSLYIFEAIKYGANSIVLEKKYINNISQIKDKKNNEDLFFNGEKLPKNITLIFTSDVRTTMAKMSANFYDNPQKKLKIVGITGTNGKTSCSYIIADLLKKFNKKVGVIGTSGIFINKKKFDATLTTPDSIELFEIFSKMVKSQVEYCIMEVSAHAIFFKKIFGIDFTVKALTNVDSDHLDFFKTKKKYANVKKSFFKVNDCCVVNIDDTVGKQILKTNKHRGLSFGKDIGSNLKYYDVKMKFGKIEFFIEYENKIYGVCSKLTGLFNVYNICLSVCVLIKLGFSIEEVLNKISKIKNISGRFDLVFSSKNLNIIIDYAHTTESLNNFLNTVSQVSSNKKIIVFGCPGERDSQKRFEMGKLAGDFCDIIIITTDNPASENSKRIMFEIECGAKSSKPKKVIFLIENRKKAIKKALILSKKTKKCEILIVGKGTENYQIIGDKKIKYSDYNVVYNLLHNDCN